MSTSRADQRPSSSARRSGRPSARLAGGVGSAVVALTLVLTGCGGDPVERSTPVPPAPVTPDDVGPDPSAPAQGGIAVEEPRALQPALTRTLRLRAEALRARDRKAFAAGLDLDDQGFLRDQATYFDNLVQLPVETLGYRVYPSSLLRVGEDYWGVVEVSLQLAGFDAEPVVTRDRYRFSPRPKGSGFVVSSVTDPVWEAANDVWSQPWDDGPVVVRSGAGVLGIFDDQTVEEAGPLVASVEAGIADVSAAVPYPWSGSAVVYALSDDDFIAGLEPPQGTDPERLDGLAFSLPTGRQGEGVASTRIALHPRMVGRPGDPRDRLVRHELTHLAVGDHADGVPLWLSEGIAEYVSVRPLAQEDRELARPALRAARRGQVTDLPDDATFGDDDEVSYAVSWWACEFLATSFGSAGLWALLDELSGTGDDADEQLQSITGLNTRTLARKAAKLIVSTYAPTSEPSRSPSSDPSGTATSAPTSDE